MSSRVNWHPGSAARAFSASGLLRCSSGFVGFACKLLPLLAGKISKNAFGCFTAACRRNIQRLQKKQSLCEQGDDSIKEPFVSCCFCHTAAHVLTCRMFAPSLYQDLLQALACSDSSHLNAGKQKDRGRNGGSGTRDSWDRIEGVSRACKGSVY